MSTTVSTGGADRAWDSHRPPDPDLIADCVHCGFCLPTCPSYVVFEEEMDSPRGRIVLMRVGNEESSEASDEMRTHFDRCLGCMACVTACPSGVKYDQLIERTRPQVERNAPRPRWQRAYRRLIFALFTHPGRLRALVPLLWAQQRLGVNDVLARVPALRPMLRIAPPVKRRAAIAQLPEVTPAERSGDEREARGRSARRGRIALMQGCVQRVFFGDVNAATVRVLAAEGWEVHAPRRPRCCGALQMHAGVEEEAIALAKETIAAYEDFEYVAVNVAGCGSGMKDYAHLLADDPEWAERAATFSARVPSTSRAPAAIRFRCASPTTMPATWRTRRRSGSSRASCCAGSRRSSCSSPPTGRSAAARRGSTTSSSPTRRPSSARARRPTSSRPAPTRSPPAIRAARCRSRRTSTAASCRSTTR
jgi:glycolate oxidase iron-sulfur subunit